MLWIHLLGWFGLMLLAIFNGIIRNRYYLNRVGDLRAHQLSTLTLLLLMSAFIWVLARCWPLASSGQALTVGGIWLVVTVLFEFAFGHYVVKKSWAVLLADYNLLKGRVWVLILLWTLLAPLVFHLL